MISRALVLPAIGVAVLPKCPVCVMVVLGALGLGHSLHDTVFAVLQGAALVVVMALLFVRRRQAPEQIVLGTAAAFGVMLGLIGQAPPAVAYTGAILLAAIWLVKPRGISAAACACTAAPSIPSP